MRPLTALTFCVGLLLACSAAAQPADGVPIWPEKAYLQLTTHQLLRDGHASGDELKRAIALGDPYGITLRWPKAVGAIAAYRLLKDGVEVITFPVKGEMHPELWEGEAQGAITWSLLAGDASGRWSKPLTVKREPVSTLLDEGKQVTVLKMIGTRGDGDRALMDILGSADGVAVALATPPKSPRPPLKLPKPTIQGGLSVEMVRRVVGRHRRELIYCVERFLPEGEALKWSLRAIINAQGLVASAKLTGEGQDHQKLRSCLKRRATRWRFPAPKGGGVVVVDQPMVMRR